MASHLDRIVERAAELVSNGRQEESWRLVGPLSDQVSSNAALAHVWLQAASASPLGEDVAVTATGIVRSYPDDRALLVGAASILTLVAETRPFDEPPLEDGPARVAANTLAGVIDSLSLKERHDPAIAADIYCDLAMALRMTGCQDDEAALEAMDAALRLRPDDGWRWFQLGLLHKWRGRWADGVEANRRARELGSDTEGVLWNLAICAMGAGFHPLAGSVMKELGMKGRVGDDGIFVGGFDPVQIRLSSSGEGVDPRAHTVGAAPQFEYVWIERLSLVHGMVVNATLYDMPVDFGDVILFDGAAIGYRDEGATRVPRFPLLQKLRSGACRRYRFRARQPRRGYLDELGEKLPERTFFYVHDEQVSMLCHDCASAGRVSSDHRHGESSFVSGKLVIPEETVDSSFVRRLDDVLGDEAVVAVPQLHRDLGDEARALNDDAVWSGLAPSVAREDVVACEKHGTTEPAYVCRHLVEGAGLGFFSSDNPETLRPDAWCGACERVRVAEGGDWNDRSEAFAQVRVICGGCYDLAKERNSSAPKKWWWNFWR